MKRVIKLTEGDLEKIVKKVLSEQKPFPFANKKNLESSFFNFSKKPKEEQIADVQWILKYQYKYNLGNTGPNKDGVDGIFGGRTEKAVKDFQTKNGLEPTGVVGEKTFPLLFKGPREKTGYDILSRRTSEKKNTKYDCIAISREECSKISKDRDVIIGSGSEKACARYMNRCLAEYDRDIAGNAWTVLTNLKNRGIGSEKYNAFKQMDWNKIWNEINTKVSSKVCECHKDDHADKICTQKVNSPIPSLVVNSYPEKPNIEISDLKLGDIVGLYYSPSTNKGQAFCSKLNFDKNGKPIDTKKPFEFNSHVGFVVSIKDGIPIILHNIGNESKGLHHATPATKLFNKNGTMIAWVASNDKIIKNLGLFPAPTN